LKMADNMLYTAKQTGRNRVVLASALHQPEQALTVVSSELSADQQGSKTTP